MARAAQIEPYSPNGHLAKPSPLLPMHTMNKLLSALLLALGGCVGVPQGLEPVQGFELERYLGTWYEIARLDHSFERGLSRVSATYSLREDGGVRVRNRGYSAKHGRWKEAVGRAYFVGGADAGHLKVSFFGPFYGTYVIVHLDRENYQYALVCGPDHGFLWILSREPQIAPDTLAMLLARAKSLGFDTEALIFVKHGED